MASSVAADQPRQTGEGHPGGKVMVLLVTALFFAWGFATVLIDTLIPKLKGLFALSYAEAMLTQFCFFAAYLVVSAPASLLLARLGYFRSIVVGLLVMAAGCLLFAPAASLGVYAGFLFALFVMASGITLLQVAANPLMAGLGDTRSSHSRLTLAQAFNSLGTTVGPLVGAALILSAGVSGPDPATTSPDLLAEFRRVEAQSLQGLFVGIAGFLAVLALIFWRVRRWAGAPRTVQTASLRSSLALLARPRLALGAVSLFLYVGAEVAIGSLMVSSLMDERTLGATAARAGQLVALYWGGAMIGRFIGSLVLRRVRPGMALAACAVGAAGLIVLAALGSGALAGYALIAIGLCNAIMFPTIFSLAIEDLGEETPQGSGLLCMAIVGGAFIPLFTGALADQFGLALALLLPGVCYLWIAGYGLLTGRRAAA